MICVFTQGFVRCIPSNRHRHCGAGIAGLAAALESARAGNQVLVVDMSTVGGGHAIVLERRRVSGEYPLSTTERHLRFRGIGEEGLSGTRRGCGRDWVELYVRDSKRSIYDWLTALGVTFDNLGTATGQLRAALAFALTAKGGV